VVTDAQIAEAVRELIPRAAFGLRADVKEALVAASLTERSERAKAVLQQLIDNADLAAAKSLPLCQDTGSVWVRIELGVDESLSGDVQGAVDRAVAEAYRAAHLRMSTVRDALFDRSNTGDNTPAFIDVGWRPGSGASVHVMLKGGGSDNASAVRMLSPDAGFDGVFDFVLETVTAKATSACPPLLVGVGVGTTFDKVGALAKRALLRPVDRPAANEWEALFEERLLDAVNETGIGPGGFGGDTTALAVHVSTAACHIAALPVAVNMGCCAVRSASAEVG
jgi:tartrate/fumarate subfamily iron-sulfur-dependent hydro-lyase alpha chain